MEYTNDSILEGIRKFVTIVNNPPIGDGFTSTTGSLTPSQIQGLQNQVDAYIDFNSNKPFERLPGPPPDSKILAYWKRGDVKAPIKLALTFGQYLAAQKIPKGGNLQKIRYTGPMGDSYSGKGNGLNNPTNLSLSKWSKLYGGNSSKKMADGQNNAVFNSMFDGLCASMHFIIDQYHGRNICQLNNQHQGYVNQDGPAMHDVFGMAALRLRWVTNKCKSMGIAPEVQPDLRDPDTLFMLVNAMSKSENSLTFGRDMLMKAYNRVKNNI